MSGFQMPNVCRGNYTDLGSKLVELTGEKIGPGCFGRKALSKRGVGSQENSQLIDHLGPDLCIDTLPNPTQKDLFCVSQRIDQLLTTRAFFTPMFLKDLGSKLVKLTGEKRVTEFLK